MYKKCIKRKKTIKLRIVNICFKFENHLYDKAEKAQAELQKALQMTKTAMESRIAEIDEEKASAVNAVKKEMVQASMEAGKQKV